MVCDKVVCERWWMKDCVWQSSVSSVWKMVCDKVVWKMVCETWCVKDGVWKMVCDGVWKMVCDKVVWKMVCQRWSVTVCERWCVTKWCERWVKDGVWQSGVKDGVWQSCVWKMVCDKVVCVRDGVWQSCVWKMVCDKVVCERWCVTKLCVWEMVCDKVVCERWCVKVGVWKTFLGITPHPLASRLAPNPNGRCSLLSFRSLFFSICLPLCSTVISSFSQRFSRFPWFFQVVFPSLPFIFSSRVFSHFPPHFPLVFNDFPSFSLVFSYLFPTVFKGPRGNRTPPSPNCLMVHAPPQKKTIWTA